MQSDNGKESTESTIDCIYLTESPHIGGSKMSSSLKERLKRSRIYSSPIARPASSFTSTASVTSKAVKFDFTDLEKNESAHSYSKEEIENCADKQKLQDIYASLQKEAAENEEKLRKLKLVQKHHNKNKPDTLTALTKKWLVTAQKALRKLYDFTPEPKNISFENLLILLQVEFDIIKYNPESDTFS